MTTWKVEHILDTEPVRTLADVFVLFQYFLPIPKVQRGQVAIDIGHRVRSLASLAGGPRDIVAAPRYDLLAPVRRHLLQFRQSPSAHTRRELVKILNEAISANSFPIVGAEGLAAYHQYYLLRAASVVLEDMDNYLTPPYQRQFRWCDNSSKEVHPCVEFVVDGATKNPDNVLSSVFMVWDAKPPACLDRTTMDLMTTMAGDGIHITSGEAFKALCGDISNESGVPGGSALALMLHAWVDLRSRQVLSAFLANDEQAQLFRIKEDVVFILDRPLEMRLSINRVSAHFEGLLPTHAGDTLLGVLVGLGLEIMKPTGTVKQDTNSHPARLPLRIPQLPINEFPPLAIFWPNHIHRWAALHSLSHIDELRPFFGPMPIEPVGVTPAMPVESNAWTSYHRITTPLMLDGILGTGVIWDVYAATPLDQTIHPLPTVVKLTCPKLRPLDDDDNWDAKMVNEAVDREAFVLQHVLVPLQGRSVPRMYGKYRGIHPSNDYWKTAEVLAVVQEDVGDAPTRLTEDDKMDIVRIYREMHMLGVLHGDPKAKHWRRHTHSKSDQPIKVIDFTRSLLRIGILGATKTGHPWEVTDFEQRAAHEMAHVLDILGLPTTGINSGPWLSPRELVYWEHSASFQSYVPNARGKARASSPRKARRQGNDDGVNLDTPAAFKSLSLDG